MYTIKQGLTQTFSKIGKILRLGNKVFVPKVLTDTVYNYIIEIKKLSKIFSLHATNHMALNCEKSRHGIQYPLKFKNFLESFFKKQKKALLCL